MNKFIETFSRARDGSVGIIFAITITLLLIVVFCAIDYARAYDEQLIVQNALDAGTLAAAASSAVTDAEIQQIGQTAFNTNANGQLKPADLTTTFSLSSDRTVVVASVKGVVSLSVPSLFGQDSVAIGARSEVQRAGDNVEVALVLDTTASMVGSALSDLKIAATDLIDTVVKDHQSPFYSKVALVPYSMAVNMGSYATNVRGPYSSDTCASPHCRYFKFKNPFGNFQTFEISTCVTERNGANAFTDAPPSVDPLGPNYPAPGNPCLANTVVPLTNDRASLKASISSLQAAGSTGGHIGVAWGWYMVSPNFGYLWPSISRPAEYRKKDLQKVVVIMTDGEYNSSYCDGVISEDSTTGSGAMADHISCNAPNGNAYAQSLSLCKNMKAEGVVVYTVGFKLTNTQQARDLVQKCATDASHIYLPSSGSELKDAFRSIGSDIAKLHISG